MYKCIYACTTRTQIPPNNSHETEKADAKKNKKKEGREKRFLKGVQNAVIILQIQTNKLKVGHGKNSNRNRCATKEKKRGRREDSPAKKKKKLTLIFQK